MLLEDIKKASESLTGLGRPAARQAKARVRERKANAWRFADDGLVPNHPAWPAIQYRGAVDLKGAPDPAAVFEVLFAAHGWKESWRDAVYDYLHYHSDQHEVLGFARGSAVLRLGGARGRTDVPKIVDWYMDKKINIDDLITHTMPLDKINDAFDLMHEGKSIRSVVIY